MYQEPACLCRVYRAALDRTIRRGTFHDVNRSARSAFSPVNRTPKAVARGNPMSTAPSVRRHEAIRQSPVDRVISTRECTSVPNAQTAAHEIFVTCGFRSSRFVNMSTVYVTSPLRRGASEKPERHRHHRDRLSPARTPQPWGSSQAGPNSDVKGAQRYAGRRCQFAAGGAVDRNPF